MIAAPITVRGNNDDGKEKKEEKKEKKQTLIITEANSQNVNQSEFKVEWYV